MERILNSVATIGTQIYSKNSSSKTMVPTQSCFLKEALVAEFCIRCREFRNSLQVAEIHKCAIYLSIFAKANFRPSLIMPIHRMRSPIRRFAELHCHFVVYSLQKIAAKVILFLFGMQNFSLRMRQGVNNFQLVKENKQLFQVMFMMFSTRCYLDLFERDLRCHENVLTPGITFVTLRFYSTSANIMRYLISDAAPNRRFISQLIMAIPSHRLGECHCLTSIEEGKDDQILKPIYIVGTVSPEEPTAVILYNCACILKENFWKN